MPYPAQNLNGSLPGQFTLTDRYGTSVNNQQGVQRVRNQHPASTSNPKRPDGTRAMRAWSHHGGRWRSEIETLGQYGTGINTVRLRGNTPAASIDTSQLKVWDGGAVTARLRALGSWAERSVQYSAALREAGKTARMVGDLGKGMANELADGLNKGKYTFDDRNLGSKVARNWKKLPGWYLEYLYGWKHVMDDISNVTDKLIRDIQLGDTMHVRLTGKWTGRGVTTVDNGLGGNWGSQFTVESDLLLEQTDRTVMKYSFPTDRMPNLEPIGFFGGLWEGAPYSHVLDWIAPVGTWLNALDANALAIYFDEGCTSTMVRCLSITDRHVNRTAIANVSMSSYGTIATVLPYRFVRKIESPWSITSRIPFRSDLNLNHAAQGLAMLSQVLRRLGG